jgi:hypothetical protein
MIPLDLFGDETDAIKDLVELYSGASYRPKPRAMQTAAASKTAL